MFIESLIKFNEKRENLIIYILHIIQDVPRNLFYQLKNYLKAKNFNINFITMQIDIDADNI